MGAGRGALSQRLVTSGATVICLEPDHASLEQARRRLAGDVELVEAPVEPIPLDDASVDAAVALSPPSNGPTSEAGLAELARVIRPDGRLVEAEFGRPGRS